MIRNKFATEATAKVKRETVKLLWGQGITLDNIVEAVVCRDRREGGTMGVLWLTEDGDIFFASTVKSRPRFSLWGADHVANLLGSAGWIFGQITIMDKHDLGTKFNVMDKLSAQAFHMAWSDIRQRRDNT